MSDDYADLVSTSYNSGSIHFTGLGSGTDFDTIVTQLVDVESQKLKNMAKEYKTWEDKVAAIQELNTSVLALDNTLVSMDSPAKFMVKSATSSDDTSLTATASTDAQVGTHSIEIHQLAQNHILMSRTGFASATTSINNTGGDETLAFTYGGENFSMTVSAGTTLASLASMINNAPDNPGVRATIMNDGSPNGYHLQLRGMDQGTTYQINVTSSPSSFGGNFDTTQAAQNAQIKVDGWPTAPGLYIERDSNTIDDVLEGITFNLHQTTPPGETITVTTSTDTAAIKEKIKTFVDQINEVLGKIRSLTEVTGNKADPLMTGNATLHSIQGRIKDVLNSRGIGFDPDKDAISSLVGQHIPGSTALTVGITTDTVLGSPTFGLLVVDEDTLNNALQKNPQAVMEIFSANLTPTSDTSDFSYHSVVSGATQPGIYDISYEVNGTGDITSATIDGTHYDYTAGAPGKSGNTLTSLHGGSKGLAITVNNLTAGTHTGTLRLKEGKISQLSSTLETLTKASSGSLTILEEHFQETAENLTDQMANEQQRLVDYEQEQRAKFARLESTLGYYNSIQTMLESQIKQLTASSKG